MSPVIAFDIAVVAQKVKVQLLYNGRHAKSEKVGGWVSSRSRWLLELLMMTIAIAKKIFETASLCSFHKGLWTEGEHRRRFGENL